MNTAFDVLVLATFFVPVASLVAAQIATWRPSRHPVGPVAFVPRVAPSPVRSGAQPGFEPLRWAA